MPGVTGRSRLFVKLTRDLLPQVRDRYPFIYLEHGRLEVDDSSIKWIDSEGGVLRIPAAMLQCLLLGPGSSVTHEAVKVLASVKSQVMWVGEDSLLYYRRYSGCLAADPFGFHPQDGSRGCPEDVCPALPRLRPFWKVLA